MLVLEQMDVVYMVKESENNEELRYSLRTLEAHFPHNRVVIVGFKPSWVQNVYHIKVPQDGQTKYKNIDKNWGALLRDDEISDNFVLFNDDFFVIDKVKELPMMYYGSLDEHIADMKKRSRPAKYIQRVQNTLDTLRRWHDVGEICSYELHMPMVIRKEMCHGLWIHCSKYKIKPYEMRSLYGNLFEGGGIRTADCKIYDLNDGALWHPFVSTTDKVFHAGKAGEMIRERYQHPSRYEV